jgi:hypothetical protein
MYICYMSTIYDIVFPGAFLIYLRQQPKRLGKGLCSLITGSFTRPNLSITHCGATASIENAVISGGFVYLV